MEIFRKMKDYLIPPEEDMEEEFDEAEEAEAAPAAIPMKSRFASSASYGAAKVANGSPYDAPSLDFVSPSPSVSSSSAADLSMKIYVPHEFGDVRRIADDLKAKRSVIINFEELKPAEQRRICDFANGVCYVMEGQARRISDVMVLYVPHGVSVSAVQSKSKLD